MYKSMEDKKKIAVVGAGAAALGALTALLDKKTDLEIIVYDIGQRVVQAPLPDNPSKEWIVSFYNKVYKKIRSLYSFKFPPPKTHFGEQIPKQPIGKFSIFKSESFGGLTNYWGATMLPFTDREMKGWPINRHDLDPYYKKISQVVGLAAGPDDLDKYFLEDFSTRPAIKPTAELNKLNQAVNNQKESKQFKIISGFNRCGLETRKDKPNSCVYCGECMAGCFKDSVYSARMTIEQYLKDNRVKYIQAKVTRVNQKDDLVELETEDGTKDIFSKIFLCAGCLHSTEIVLRSLDIRKKLIMADNAVYVFPILYFGKKLSQDDLYLSLCNLIFGCIPKDENEHFAQVQIYPNFDYLWRYNFPSKLWSIFRGLSSFSRPRLSFARLYLHSDYSQAYSIELKDNQLIMVRDREAQSGKRVKEIISSIKKAVNHQGFYIPSIPPIKQKGNTHYTSTLPFNGKIKVSSLGEIMSNVYLSDSTVFPNSPAINPGFTIMANACRIADKVIN